MSSKKNKVTKVEETEVIETPTLEVEETANEAEEVIETPTLEVEETITWETTKITFLEDVLFLNGLQKKGTSIEVSSDELVNLPKKWYK